MTAADERAKIEHELEILRERYALMQKWARITQCFVLSATGVIALIMIAAIVMQDEVAAGVSFIALICATLYLLWRWGDRWIDAISPPSTPWRTWQMPSEAQVIEIMIAEREKRLEELARSG